MKYLYTFGIVAGILMAGAEGETLTQTITCGSLGLLLMIVSGVLLASSLDKPEGLKK